MESTVIVALISFGGTLLGTAGGIVASAKLTEYRLTQLEKKLEAVSAVAAKLPVVEEKQKMPTGEFQSLSVTTAVRSLLI